MKKNYDLLPSWLRFQRFYRARLNREHNIYKSDRDSKLPAQECHPYDANIISSERSDGNHYLLLDLDAKHFYQKSSYPGHAHLFINKDLSREDMLEVLGVLAKHGIVQQGYYQASVDKGFAALRMPELWKTEENDRWFYDQLPIKKKMGDLKKAIEWLAEAGPYEYIDDNENNKKENYPW